MAGKKNNFNNQWGRVSSDYNSAPSSPDENYGKEPLIDDRGAIWVRQIPSGASVWIVGGYARYLAPINVIEGDEVPFTTDLQKRLQVNHELAIAGENNTFNYLAVQNKPVPHSQDAYDISVSESPETQRQAKLSFGRFYGAWGYNISYPNTPLWLMVFDDDSQPVPGATVPLASVFCGPAQVGNYGNNNVMSCYLEVPPQGIFCNEGIAVAFSDLPGLYSPVSDCLYSVLYK